MVHIAQQARAGQQGHVVGQGQLTGGVLEAKGAHLRGGRADESDARGLAGFGKARVL